MRKDYSVLAVFVSTRGKFYGKKQLSRYHGIVILVCRVRIELRLLYMLMQQKRCNVILCTLVNCFMSITYIKAYTLPAKHTPVSYARDVSPLWKFSDGNWVKIRSFLISVVDVVYFIKREWLSIMFKRFFFVIADDWKHATSFITIVTLHHQRPNKNSNCE